MNSKPMPFKPIATTLVGLLSVAVIALGFFSFSSGTAISDLIEEVVKEEPRNSLGGRIGSDGPILVVKIDDTARAHPQAGLEDADIVYIEQVEGGLTRLAAIFSSKIPELIGPVRSARISDIEILKQFGRVVFAYSGAQQKLLPVIAAADLENFGAQRQSPEIYPTDPKRTSPTAMMLRADKLMLKVADAQLPVVISRPIGWSFGPAPETGTAILAAKVSWPASSYDVTWSEVEQRWLLANRGVPDLSTSGVHLGPTTFVIQKIKITDSQYGDKFGGITPYSNTVGSGSGYILRDGKSIPANWERLAENTGTTWRTLLGEEIKFAPGQVWVALVDQEPSFTAQAVPDPALNGAGATKSTTK
ncbi:MAG: DUF3048 domain-containing protein [Candidatus Planktophila sp.]